MTDLQFAANVSDGFMFNEAGDLLQRYRAARNFGFENVECANPYGTPVEQIAEVLEETGMKQVLINAFAGPNKGDLGQAILPISDEEFEIGMRRSINTAKALRCSNVHFLAGKVPKGVPRNSLMPLYLRRLKWAAKESLPRHVNLLLEPISPFVSDAYFLNHYGTAVDVVNELECRNVKIQLDLFHFQQLHPKYDVVKWARVNQKAVGHIQIAQSPQRNEPHAKGDIDYGKILPALAEIFPDLYCGLEYKPSGATEAGLLAGKAAGPVFDYAASFL
ncbi:putative hydroxypyruvate isomerase [Hypsibius exemplaris]|uniref:Putative hydroxypyruvate isomerase n=1 Tax=Hypsibius exemplaris TaxID=2072580 RepID=A0A9X6NFK2_HYPEX|nr:putative hydroxypyruvate isomerase [Hypsibius exemplaris]